LWAFAHNHGTCLDQCNEPGLIHSTRLRNLVLHHFLRVTLGRALSAHLRAAGRMVAKARESSTETAHWPISSNSALARLTPKPGTVRTAIPSILMTQAWIGASCPPKSHLPDSPKTESTSRLVAATQSQSGTGVVVGLASPECDLCGIFTSVATHLRKSAIGM